MSIKARLTIAVLVVLTAVFAVMGIAMARSTESTLIHQCDIDVRTQAERMHAPKETDKGPDADKPDSGPPGDELTPVAGPSGDPDYDDGERTIATFVYRSDGTLKESKPSGYDGDRDSPPDIQPVGSAEFTKHIGHIQTLSAIDGSLEYRVIYRQDPDDGAYYVVAAPLDDVRSAVRELITRFLIIGVASLAIVAFAIWWVIRNEFRPVDTMVDTAAAIAGGDLSRRVPDADPKTELGRLGGALNEMLGQIEAGLKQRDVTEARLRRFVADAAHELRTPLTSVRGYSELYRQGAYPDGPSIDHAMARIESEGSRMARLVDDLLLLARMDQHRAIEQRPMDLVSLANEAATDFETVASDHPLEWNPEGELVVRGDRIRIRQIIDNLLSNARMHTPSGTLIRMTVRRDGSEAEIEIADEGPGIAAADREMVFERFWRADSSRTRNTGGSGLGLSIVQSLVVAHGGTVRLESEPGKGARFTIRIPLLIAP